MMGFDVRLSSALVAKQPSSYGHAGLCFADRLHRRSLPRHGCCSPRLEYGIEPYQDALRGARMAKVRGPVWERSSGPQRISAKIFSCRVSNKSSTD